ncbi:MAG: hypothetical protein CR989_03905 [Flavobacteriales bacterium]|nr:MAG: hypothetical protein CR989_03905 [Flavobacteriales bacterium]
MIIDAIVHKKSNGQSAVIGKDKFRRSCVKALTWRILGTFDTIVISWIITGTFSMALTIGGIEIISKMVLYFFHERIWNTINWGKWKT